MNSLMNEVWRIWDLRDKRTDYLPLMSSPLPTALICAGYYFLVKVWGPRFMANRPAYDLRGVLVLYNLFQILFNGWIFYEIAVSTWLHKDYSLFCFPVDYSNSETALRGMRAGYMFFISKFIDFLDTIFFVLRKKEKQITVLHLYHHGMLPLILWPGVRYVCGGHASFFAFLNTLVHVVMYFYYLVAAMGPRFERFIWWKKYLTTFQIVQFVVASVHSIQVIFYTNCNFPKAFGIWIGVHELCYLALFVHFYRTAYRKRKSSATEMNNNVVNGKKKL